MVRRVSSSSQASFLLSLGTSLVFQQSPRQLDHSRYITALKSYLGNAL